MHFLSVDRVFLIDIFSRVNLNFLHFCLFSFFLVELTVQALLIDENKPFTFLSDSTLTEVENLRFVPFVFFR